MQISLIFQNSLPSKLAIFRAAQSAMSTAILTKANAFDLSRLSLIRYSCQAKETPKSSEILAHCEITLGETSNAGSHHLVRIELCEGDQTPFACAEFEIIDRKRGLKSSVLRNLWEPKTRISGDFEQKSVTLENIFEQHPALCELKSEEEKWPLEALFAAGIEGSLSAQVLNFHVNFLLFGSANSETPCEIRVSKSLTANPGLIEIIQENVLIAQVN